MTTPAPEALCTSTYTDDLLGTVTCQGFAGHIGDHYWIDETGSAAWTAIDDDAWVWGQR